MSFLISLSFKAGQIVAPSTVAARSDPEPFLATLTKFDVPVLFTPKDFVSLRSMVLLAHYHSPVPLGVSGVTKFGTMSGRTAASFQ